MTLENNLKRISTTLSVLLIPLGLYEVLISKDNTGYINILLGIGLLLSGNAKFSKRDLEKAKYVTRDTLIGIAIGFMFALAACGLLLLLK